MPKPFPEEFRRDVVAVARKGDAWLSQVARDFGISQSCLSRWVRRAEIEEGKREGLTLAEEAEIRQLKKRNLKGSETCRSASEQRLCTIRRCCSPSATSSSERLSGWRPLRKRASVKPRSSCSAISSRS